jgi:hypothetical protein
MPLLPNPEALLRSDGGAMELSTDGDPTTAALILRRLVEEFGATIKERYFRNLMGDTEREREYWFLNIRGCDYLLMRCTAPEAPPGICVLGPIKTREELALFRAIAQSFGATEREQRPFKLRAWWHFWG